MKKGLSNHFIVFALVILCLTFFTACQSDSNTSPTGNSGTNPQLNEDTLMQEIATEENDLLLCYIYNKPYYYDPIYLFKYTGQAFPEEPSALDKKRAVASELYYYEGLEKGGDIPDDWVKEQIITRQQDIVTWQSYAQEPDNADMEENMDYINRYLELYASCIDDTGGEEDYWQQLTPYLQRDYYAYKYSAHKAEEYIGLHGSNFNPNVLLEVDWDYLIDNHDIEIVDKSIV